MPHYRVRPLRVSAAINIWIVAILKTRLTRIFIRPRKPRYRIAHLLRPISRSFADDIQRPYLQRRIGGTVTERLRKIPHDPFDVTRKKPTFIFRPILINLTSRAAVLHCLKQLHYLKNRRCMKCNIRNANQEPKKFPGLSNFILDARNTGRCCLYFRPFRVLLSQLKIKEKRNIFSGQF